MARWIRQYVADHRVRTSTLRHIDRPNLHGCADHDSGFGKALILYPRHCAPCTPVLEPRKSQKYSKNVEREIFSLKSSKKTTKTMTDGQPSKLRRPFVTAIVSAAPHPPPLFPHQARKTDLAGLPDRSHASSRSC
jgi:hypothetical protein